ncbi:uncharacterized protein (DUF736 family) [Rhodopseudomonas thermotolerans]|uniref:Uncharacterized protein (DUF736 family) n=2 Tax=Rhodopseudomonas TaxID=1073 RepID=A0A336JTS9_9BRAD|nr:MULTISPECIES: DUF736 domain-containing protein [Rhodopseudomonas]RED25565.1 uncharacterized protein (DUF736 family) [Rhodopseudomonas pentothenatexigens]REF90395.1 uncharacterized protein (DUF736 family) [Rhodopseudomonas thermotolerans]SSW93177.1 uncharacterized protein SAMN05892882_13133 [Rhodopseudomonas pentothenatexigens]
MIIGNFTYDKKADTYAGDITTLTFQRGEVQIRPAEKTGAAKEPDYRIVTQTPNGTVEFGAAWDRKSEAGKSFLSVQIDDPALGEPLNAALFVTENGKGATLIWSRYKKKTVSD